jgi:hypothetical protein
VSIPQHAIARPCLFAIERLRVRAAKKIRVSRKYLIYSANMIMYKVVQVAGQIGGRQLT